MTNPKFQLFKSTTNGQYYFRLKAKSNGENILSGEGYTTKQNCMDGIASVKKHAPDERNYERKDNSFNHTFNLKASNGEIIGRSENYTTRVARENGIEAVKRDAPVAPIEDLT